MIIPYTPDPMSNVLLQYWANLLTALSALYGEQSGDTAISDDVPIVYGKGYQMFTYVNTVQKYFFYRCDVQIDEQSLTGQKPLYANFDIFEIPYQNLTSFVNDVKFEGTDVSVDAISSRIAMSDFTPPANAWNGGFNFQGSPMHVALPYESGINIPLKTIHTSAPVTDVWTDDVFVQWYYNQGSTDFSPRLTADTTTLKINMESPYAGMKTADGFKYKYEPAESSIYIKPSTDFTYEDIRNLFNVYIIPDIQQNYPDLTEEPLEFPLFDFQEEPEDNPIIHPLQPIKIPQAPSDLETEVLTDGFTFLGDVTTWYYNLLSDFGLSAVLAVVLFTTIVLRKVGGK